MLKLRTAQYPCHASFDLPETLSAPFQVLSKMSNKMFHQLLNATTAEAVESVGNSLLTLLSDTDRNLGINSTVCVYGCVWVCLRNCS